MTHQTMTQERPLTLAEICQAIEQGDIVADMEQGYYTLNMRDLVRLARQGASPKKVAPPRQDRLALAS